MSIPITKYLNLICTVIFALVVIYIILIWQEPDSFLFAWVLNFMLMMCLLSYTKTVKPALSSPYYDLKPWEREGSVYKYFGVNFFRKILVWTGWEKLHKKENPIKKIKDNLRKLEYATRQSEFGHIVIFVIVMTVAIYITVDSGLRSAVWLLLLNIILNLFPIMVQRYNRPRIRRLLSIE